MSLEDAMMRRVRLGQSFCSYSFKRVKKMKGQTFIKAERNHRYLANRNDTKFIQTADTICLSASRLKSTARQSSRNPHEKQAEPLLLKTKSPSIQQTLTEKQSLHSYYGTSKEKRNKMDEYLSDFYELRSDFEFKSNKYENIPRMAHHKYKPDHHRTDNYMKIQPCDIVKKDFYSDRLPELFYDFPLDQNSVELPFTLFRLVNLKNKVYLEAPIGEKLFSEIPIKQYCHLLNKYSTDLQENIFYLALSKQKLQGQSLAYTEGFFWISKPIKHTQRLSTLKSILKFYIKCLKQIEPASICPKIWIVDFNGRISYLNRQEILRYMEDPENERNIKYSQLVANAQISGVCLSMFLCSIKRGNFYNINNSLRNESKFSSC